MKILVIDSHPIVLSAVKREIKEHKPEAKITLFSELDKGIESAKKNHYELIIIEIGISDFNLQTLKELRKIRWNSKILLYSSMNEGHYALLSVASGANGFISKESAVSELINAIDTVLDSKTYFSPKVRQALLSKVIANETASSSNPLKTLTPREKLVTHLLVKGMKVVEISKMLDLQASTVSTFKASIFKKMQVNNILALSRQMEILN